MSEPDVHVAIVEDHELLATTLALALRHHGLLAETVAAPSAAAVVDAVRHLNPRLVLLDLELGSPVGSGLALIGPLIEGGTRVVMMTGITERSRLAACVEAGAAGIVSKTAGFGDLVDAVRRAALGEELLTASQRQSLLSELRAHRHTDRKRQAPFESLTRREQQVLARLMAGESAQTIAKRSYVSLATVRSQIRSILQKLGTNSQLAAVALARDAGWTPPGALVK